MSREPALYKNTLLLLQQIVVQVCWQFLVDMLLVTSHPGWQMADIHSLRYCDFLNNRLKSRVPQC